MSTYVIGDVQGCYQSLLALLDKLEFNETSDELWFVGDLVNRGPDSLSVLRFIKNLKCPYKVVLGNHDIHLLAIYAGVRKLKRSDTLRAVLEADDIHEIIDWLRYQPLAYINKEKKLLMVHAGVLPGWDAIDVEKANARSEKALRSDKYVKALKKIYAKRNRKLKKAVAALTRIRLCDTDGVPDYKYKGTMYGSHGLVPWFKLLSKELAEYKILFGHWAALMGETKTENVLGLDTGCVWGGSLTAYCLESEQKTSVGVCDDVDKYEFL